MLIIACESIDDDKDQRSTVFNLLFEKHLRKTVMKFKDLVDTHDHIYNSVVHRIKVFINNKKEIGFCFFNFKFRGQC